MEEEAGDVSARGRHGGGKTLVVFSVGLVRLGLRTSRGDGGETVESHSGWAMGLAFVPFSFEPWPFIQKSKYIFYLD